MKKLMVKPVYTHSYYKTTLDDSYFDLLTGQEVMFMFYNKGVYKNLNYIPRELQEKNWKPDLDKKYLVWWDSTNPADHSDFGHDYIDYIEESDDNYINKIKERVLEKLNILKDKEILNLAKKLDIKF